MRRFWQQVGRKSPDAGPKVRAYDMLRHLARRHAVTPVSFVRPDDRPEHVAHLRGIAAAVHTVPIRRSAARNVLAGVRGLLTGLPVALVVKGKSQ